MADSEKYLQIFTRGYDSSLSNLPLENGKIRITKDTHRLLVDISDPGTEMSDTTSVSRIEISDFIRGLTAEEIESIVAPLPKIYIASDTNHLYTYTNRWIDLSSVGDFIGGNVSTYHTLSLRTGTTPEWGKANPILHLGEIVYDSTMNAFKVGDGTKTYSTLDYIGVRDDDFGEEDAFDMGSEDDGTSASYIQDTVDLDYGNEDIVANTITS